MKYTKSDSRYIIRLERGEQLVKTLTEFCEKENIKSGGLWAIGAVQSAELGFYNIDQKDYRFKKFDTTHEIASLIGNVSQVDGKPFLHIHTVLSDDEFNCFGGHLKGAIVAATCEVYLTDLGVEINRKKDEEIGLKLLDCQLDA